MAFERYWNFYGKTKGLLLILFVIMLMFVSIMFGVFYGNVTYLIKQDLENTEIMEVTNRNSTYKIHCLACLIIETRDTTKLDCSKNCTILDCVDYNVEQRIRIYLDSCIVYECDNCTIKNIFEGMFIVALVLFVFSLVMLSVPFIPCKEQKKKYIWQNYEAYNPVLDT